MHISVICVISLVAFLLFFFFLLDTLEFYLTKVAFISVVMQQSDRHFAKIVVSSLALPLNSIYSD